MDSVPGASGSSGSAPQRIRHPGPINCMVCDIAPKKNEKNYTHYGAVTCLSCKAFFRRTHRDQKTLASFKCKKNGKCVVNSTNRTKCKQCRYLKCLKAGMDPRQVLLDEQDRKKYTHPKKNKRRKNINPDGGNQSLASTEEGAPATTTGTGSFLDIDDPAGSSERFSPIPSCSGSSAHRSMEEGDDSSNNDGGLGTDSDGNMSPQEEHSPLQIGDVSPPSTKGPAKKRRKSFDHAAMPELVLINRTQSSRFGSKHSLDQRDMSKQLIDNLVLNHTVALAEVAIDTDIVERIIRFQIDPQKYGIDSKVILQLCQCMEKQFAAFAAKDPHFKSLAYGDRQILLARNSSMLFHYFLARYLNAESGLDQLTWLLGPHTPNLDVINSLTLVNMAQLNRHARLFSNDSMLELMSYLDDCILIGRHFSYPQYLNGLLFHILLFNLKSLTTEELNNLEDLRKIQYFYEDSKELLRFGCLDVMIEQMGINKVDQLMETLKRMQATKEQPNVWSPFSDQGVSFKHQSLSHGGEHWLKNQFILVDNTLYGLAPNEDMMKLVSMSADPSAHSQFSSMKFNQLSLRLNTARFETIIRLHPELQSLTVQERETLLQKNFPRARFLMVSRFNTRPNMLEQVKVLMGYEGVFKNHTVEGFSSDIPPIDISKTFLALFSPEDQVKFVRLSHHIGYFTDDPEIYKLFMLSILLDNSSNKKVNDLQATYINLMCRKVIKDLKLDHVSSDPIDDFNVHRDILKCYSMVMSNTDAMVRIMMKYLPFRAAHPGGGTPFAPKPPQQQP